MQKETRAAKMLVTKSGGTAGGEAVSYRASIPTKWAKSLGIDKDNREIILEFDGETITLRKNE